MRLLIASKNRGKIKEIKSIIKGKVEILSPLDLHLDISILEDGDSLKENAVKKALVYYKRTGICTLGEDTALEVNFLRGKPGVHSARYSGGGDAENRRKLLIELRKTNERGARFKTVMALVLKDNWVEYFEGIVEGEISRVERGNSGFGYDPIFFPSGYNKTFGEMDEQQKNMISHRRRALIKVLDFLQRETEVLKDLCI